MFNTSTLERAEALALGAREAAGRLALLEAAELVYSERPYDERAEGRLRDAVVRAQDARDRFQARQLIELEREGWVIMLPDEIAANPKELPVLTTEILDLDEAVLHLASAGERQKSTEQELWTAVCGGNKPSINLAALTVAKALEEYREALMRVLASRPRS